MTDAPRESDPLDTPSGEPTRPDTSQNAGPSSDQSPQIRQQAIGLRAIRGAFLTLLVIVTLVTILQVDGESSALAFNLAVGWPFTVLFAGLLGAAVLGVDVLTRTKKISTFSGIFFGLLAAVPATFAISFVIDLLAQTYELTESPLVESIKVLVGICLSYLAVTTILQTQDDFRLVIPYVEFAKEARGVRPIVLDTSVLIDGRIVDLGQSGIVQSPLIIPAFVINELQTLSDSADKLKRQRGRRGLDVVTKLQRDGGLDVSVDSRRVGGVAVDQMLVNLASEMNAIVATGDTGLASVAAIQGVGVINIHDVADAVRQRVQPGEHVTLKLIREGEQDHQAVGYLPDGTMVVCDHGRDLVGSTAELEVTGSVPTTGGRLVFARPTGTSDPNQHDDAADEPPQDTASTTSEGPGPSTRPRRPTRGRNPRR
ncbi:MAG: PIN/TRAM domain-containing protein [Planctomycetota bacterium]